MPKYYAEIILPVPLENSFTYAVPDAMVGKIAVGYRVVVQFGVKHYYTGIVQSLTTVRPEKVVNLKEISLLLDDSPIIRNPQLKLWEWISSYYLCSVGDVFKAALPSGLKIESETRVSIHPEAAEGDFSACGNRDMEILDYVSHKGNTTVKELEKALDDTKVQAAVTRLIDRGLLVVNEKLVERYRSVKKAYVRVTLDRDDDGVSMRKAFESVKKSARQQQMLVAILALTEFNRKDAPLVDVPLEVLLERTESTRPVVKALADKEICEIFNKEISRFSYEGPVAGGLPVLSQVQQKALNEIHKSFIDHEISLLHGVTSSGKTEIYAHLIDFVLKKGEQVLMLVPEIALTTQLTTRLQKIFGDKVVIYHSKFSDNERVDIWRRLLQTSEPLVVLGARSAVFLPFAKLGLVIVDEEHESSYKQADPAPRYNGRDVATVLAKMHGAKSLFGSATPSVETYYKATTGKFGLITLSERYAGASLPAIELVNMKERRNRSAEFPALSHRLINCVAASAGNGSQSILFHNRRGYAPLARCKMCAFTPKCDHCDVALTYHKRHNKLQCHYCGAEYPVPQLCPQCHEPHIEVIGFGTERLEDDLDRAFSSKKVLRMDLDTTRNKNGYANIIDEFSQGHADILVGTQMVTKGLDFGGVKTVGIISADSLINFPDFRSAERAFNMMEQVAGRAGRREGSGTVIIQTYNIDHPLLGFVARHDYNAFYEYELEQRQRFGFPPFMRIINIYLKHRDARTLQECAAKYADSLRQRLGDRVLGPQEPPVARVQSLFIRKIMLKLEPTVSMAKVKQFLREHYIRLQESPLMKGLQVYYDVDPV